MASSPKARSSEKFLEIRAREAPIDSGGYRGVLSQRAIAEVAGAPVRVVTEAAVAMDEMKAARSKGVQ